MESSEVVKFANSQSWSGYTVNDLREALRSLILLTLKGPADPETVAYWRGRCDAELDFLVYSLALVDVRGADDDPDKDVGHLVQEWASLPLSVTSRQNLLPVYLNTYFFKYIAAVELPKLQVASTNPQLTLQEGIDFYITHLLYTAVVEENPGTFFTYEQIPGVDAQRIAALHQVRDDLVTSLRRLGPDRLESLIGQMKTPFGRTSPADAELLVPVFRSLFLLMTYYVGSNYRRVHDAVTQLLGVDMAGFRTAFFEQLPTIIRLQGSLVPQISVEATLADREHAAHQTPNARVIPPPPAEGSAKAAGGCYVATAIYGSYDCPDVWVLRRYRDQALARSGFGRAFIRTYYRLSPAALRVLGERGTSLLRRPVEGLVELLRDRGYSDAPYSDTEV